MKKVNWGIIGLGAVATQFAKGFSFVDNGKLLGVASSNSERLNNLRIDETADPIEYIYCLETSSIPSLF